ncbi:MAG: hypothetical protein JST84_04925 [Acidobacteria bacterium]|nr:hypothetical protein [Acidobacteriota bacterium]
MTKHILNFSYCYRDAAGYKKHGEIPIRSGFQPQEATNELLPFLHDGEFFIARQVGIPEIFLEEPPTNSDHCWHSFSGITEGKTDEPPSLSFEEFRTRFRAASQIGWKEFTYDEFGKRLSLSKLPTLRQARTILLRHKRPYRGSVLAAHATWREGRLVIAITMPPLQRRSALAYTEGFHQQYSTWPVPTWQGIPVDFQFFTESDRFAPEYQEFDLCKSA